MKLSIDRSTFVRALSHVQSVVERRNTIPILGNILLRAEKGKLFITASDMDLEVIETIDAEIVTARLHHHAGAHLV